MAEKILMKGPNYKRIYQDLIKQIYPHRWQEFQYFFSQRAQFSSFDVITLNKMLFGSAEDCRNRKLRVYTQSEIQKIIHLQKFYGLNNSQAAAKFNISRNSISKWNKMYG